MSGDELRKLQDDYYEYQRNSKIGMYITIAGMIAMFAKFFWLISDSEYLIGAIIGGGAIYWGINQEKLSSTKKQLNQICLDKFGKSYIESIGDIVSELRRDTKKPWE